MRNNELVTVAQLTGFDEVIDVRSEAEFAEDHIPGAINLPALNNEERARVGTLYTQVSPFDAKKIGAALISRNIARHLDETLSNRPRNWKPLVYCWRGGQRSDAFTTVLQHIGWRANRLAGGYKAYRHAVIDDLAVLPAQFSWRVVCGMTGAGKSRLLRALAKAGAQVLDLEALAAHRGSVLGVDLFRTGWFIESTATQILVIFVIRTAHPWTDRPHPWLVGSSLAAFAVAVVLPWTPLAAWRSEEHTSELQSH